MVQDISKGLVAQEQAGHLQQWSSSDDDNENSLASASTGEFEYQTGLKFREEKKHQESFDSFQQAAQLGHAKAYDEIGFSAYQLAEAYETGADIKQNTEKAIYYYELSMDKGLRIASFKLGKIYQDGKLVQQDIDKAIYYYQDSADKGLEVAAFKLGMMHYNYFMKVPDILAVHYLEMVKEKFLLAKSRLVGKYTHGSGVKKNYETALTYITQVLQDNRLPKDDASREKYVSGLYEPLMVISEEFYKNRNYNQAYKVFETFTQLGINMLCMQYSYVSFVMGLMHYLHKIDAPNLQTAYELFKSTIGEEKCDDKTFDPITTATLDEIAVELFNEDTEASKPSWSLSSFILKNTGNYANLAKTYMAKMNLIGLGVEKDITEALALLEEARLSNSSDALVILCDIYANGYGVEKNLIKATEFCEKLKSENTCFKQLGILYYATNQFTTAAECFKLIPDQTYAAEILSIMYIDGAEVGRNLPLAREWALKTLPEVSDYLLQIIDVDIPDKLNSSPETPADWVMKLNYAQARLTGLASFSEKDKEKFFPEQYEELSVTFKFI